MPYESRPLHESLTSFSFSAHSVISHRFPFLLFFNTHSLTHTHRFPRFSPSHVLDYGSGTGSVIWAANRRWSDSLLEHYCVDVSPVMRQLAEKLMLTEIEPDWSEEDVDFTQRKKNR